MDRQEAIMRIVEHMFIHKIGEYPHIYIKEALVMAIAALQEEPVKHGRWIIGLDGSYMCSQCGRVFRYDIGNYCSNCGTKLILED